MNLSSSQKHCLKILDIPLWKESVGTNTSTDTKTILSGKKVNPHLYLVLNSEGPEKILAGKQLLEDVLQYLNCSIEDVGWCRASEDINFPENICCPIWPQNESTAKYLKETGIAHLPSMAKILNQCATKAELLTALSSAKKQSESK